MRYSRASPTEGVTVTFRFPLVSLPKPITPSISVIRATPHVVVEVSNDRIRVICTIVMNLSDRLTGRFGDRKVPVSLVVS